MKIRRRDWVLSLGVLHRPLAAVASELDAPNPIRISPRLLTAGQPTEQALSSLGQMGIEVVIYLAPSTVPDAVKDEPSILARQGIEFIHLPIPSAAPQEAHLKALSQALLQRRDRSVLVHCQVNMRASTMVFLHRVVALREPPAEAYEAVARVWRPEGAWRRLMLEVLQHAGVDFQPL